jgi:ABC-type dipeptide/oligopeptide/nickel transport system permease subunit
MKILMYIMIGIGVGLATAKYNGELDQLIQEFKDFFNGLFK